MGLRTLFSIVSLSFTAPALLSAQTITGTVTDAAGGPLAAVTVSVEGTTLGAITRDDGTYRIGGVSAGAQTVVARRVGYTLSRRSVNVGAGDVTVDFQLSAAATSLEGVTTTATGQQRKIELGNTIEAIDVAARTETAPVRNIGDLLNAQATGVQILPGTLTGTVSRIRIRGQSSTALSNDPIYIIDGVRMTSSVGGVSMGGGGTVSRVNDINPEEIESIEIVKGPSAATLYGTDAANGVIVITTKRGKAGPARWTFHGERGRIEDRNPYPANFNLRGKSVGSAVQRECQLYEIAQNNLNPAQGCVLDSAVSQDIWNDPELTPLHPGARNLLGGQVSGGTNELRYFVSGDYQSDNGVFGLPKFERRRWDTLNVTVDDYQERPNYLKQYAFRGNLNAAVNPELDLSLSTGLTFVDIGLPRNAGGGRDGNGTWQAVSLGPGYDDGTSTTQGFRLYGYSSLPGMLWRRRNQEVANRFIGSTNANWRPLSWLAATADVGVDLTDRRDRIVSKNELGIGSGSFAQDQRARILNFSTNLRGTGTWQARPWAQLRSTVGMQTVMFNLNGITTEGTGLPPGAESPSQGATITTTTQSAPSRTLGMYVEEQLALRDRLFITGAVRNDQNSAFGTNFQSVYYPKASVSWIASDETFFPTVPFLNQLRLRASIGASGVQPTTTAAIRTYTAPGVFYRGTLGTGLRLDNPGNPDLKPERSTELEAGFDTRWWEDRVNVEFTYYRKQTSDALINQPVGPSAGVNEFLVNLGGIQNAGIEYRVGAQLVDTRDYGFDLTFSGSDNRNKITSLGSLTPVTSGQQRNVVGKPVNSVFVRAITYNDGNSDGLLAPTEVTIAPASEARYIGPRLPPVQMTLTAGAEFLQRRLRVSTLLDRRAGGFQNNGEFSFLCQFRISCKEMQRLDTPLERQARAVAAYVSGVTDGYQEKVDFIKWREVSASYDFGESLSQRWFRSQNARLSVGARNLELWTDWTGIDPEAVIPSNADVPAGNLTSGAPSYFMVRLNLTY